MSNLILSFQILSYLAMGGFIWKLQSILLATFKVNNPDFISAILTLTEYLICLCLALYDYKKTQYNISNHAFISK